MQFIYNILGMFANASDYLNPVINLWFPVVILVLVGIADLVWLVRWIYRDGANKGMFSFTKLVFTEAGIIFYIVILPKLIVLLFLYFIFILRRVIVQVPEDVIRWIIFYLTSFVVLLYTREHGERRGFFSYLVQLTVLLVGWLVGKWSGILFLSLPLLGVYYLALYYFAQAVVPVSDPDSPGLHYKDIPLLKKSRQAFRNRRADAFRRVHPGLAAPPAHLYKHYPIGWWGEVAAVSHPGLVYLGGSVSPYRRDRLFRAGARDPHQREHI
jgi:hypothetical protein